MKFELVLTQQEAEQLLNLTSFVQRSKACQNYMNIDVACNINEQLFDKLALK